MEALTRLVSESLARHGFDRPLDYRRLQWSRWFRCDSPHSLLQVPSKPGVFALAQEMMDFDHGATVTSPIPQCEASGSVEERPVEERPFRAALPSRGDSGALAPARRMLAVTQFFETDDMAFVLDRMLSHHNPMRVRLASGRYFVRFVVIEDESQRRSICSALNQWIVNSAEKATGIGSHFATSLELTPQTETESMALPSNVARTLLSATADTTHAHVETAPVETAASAVPPERSEASSLAPPKEILSSERGKADPATTQGGADPLVRPAGQSEVAPFVNPALVSTPTTPHLNSGAATNFHCPFPSGF